jgi:hypothetical protein
MCTLHLSNGDAYIVLQVCFSSFRGYKRLNRDVSENFLGNLSLIYKFSELVSLLQLHKSFDDSFIILLF